MKKIILKITAFVLIAILVFPSHSFAARKKKSTPKGVSARAAILSDSTNVKRLYGKNVHNKVLPASTVKVMTAIMVMEKLSLDQVITVSSRATGAQPSKIYVRAGEKYRVRDLLYAILLNSANDAAIVLAEAVAGSEWKFVQMMNQRAKEIGAKNTKFSNASGLPSPKVSQYTTAYDMYMIFRHALKFDFFKQAIRQPYKQITTLGGRKISLKSHNKILFKKDWHKKVYGKTGYTRAAQSCFVGTIQKGEATLIIAVFGCSRRWDDIRLLLRKYGGIVL